MGFVFQDIRAILSSNQMDRVIDEYEATGTIIKNRGVMVQPSCNFDTVIVSCF